MSVKNIMSEIEGLIKNAVMSCAANCSACYEATENRIRGCNHKLCVGCFETLKSGLASWETHVKCPICRTLFTDIQRQMTDAEKLADYDRLREENDQLMSQLNSTIRERDQMRMSRDIAQTRLENARAECRTSRRNAVSESTAQQSRVPRVSSGVLNVNVGQSIKDTLAVANGEKKVIPPPAKKAVSSGESKKVPREKDTTTRPRYLPDNWYKQFGSATEYKVVWGVNHKTGLMNGEDEGFIVICDPKTKKITAKEGSIDGETDFMSFNKVMTAYKNEKNFKGERGAYKNGFYYNKNLEEWVWCEDEFIIGNLIN